MMELTRNWRTLPFSRKLILIPYIVATYPMIAYFCNDTEISAEALEEEISKTTAVEKIAFADCLAQSKKGLLKYLQAARKVNILFAIPPAIFVGWFALLNLASHAVLDTPVLRAIWQILYRRLTRDTGDPRWLRNCTLDVRPLFLTWSLLVPPITLLLMLFHFCRTVLAAVRRKKQPEIDVASGCLRLKQNVDKSLLPDRTNFFSSPWFTAVVLAPFILGIPGMISLWIYWHLGIDLLLGHPSRNHEFVKVFEQICLYIYPLSWCLCALFFRSYFSFAFNFVSSEHEVEIYPDMIVSLPIKGWFADFMTMRGAHMPCQIRWSDVTSVKFSTAKLQAQSMKGKHSWLQALEKLSSVYESVANKFNVHTDYLLIASKTSSTSINLWELTVDEKKKLFQTLRLYAPTIYLDEEVQKALVGSTVLREPRYTEIWFSILGTQSGTSRSGDLEPNCMLNRGRYQIVKKIASGGQAVVYQGKTEVGTLVVLKEFQLTPGENLAVMIESARDFQNESTILSQLSHPSVVKQQDIFYEDSRVYIVLEHIDGQSLREIVASKGALPDDELVSCAQQMASILQYLHAQEPPIVHRDFTPDNIIRQPDGQLKLIDFSIAQRKKDKEISNCAGKHAYTPPEQFRGQACPQSDVYALGSTMYYLATGCDPAPLMRAELPIDTTLTTDCTRRTRLASIISAATELDLERRYQSADWLISELKAIEQPEEPTQAEASEHEEKEADNITQRQAVGVGQYVANSIILKALIKNRKTTYALKNSKKAQQAMRSLTSAELNK